MSAAHDYFMILILKSASGSSSSRATGKIENPVRDVCDTHTHFRVNALIKLKL